jgi:hypothetical protein
MGIRVDPSVKRLSIDDEFPPEQWSDACSNRLTLAFAFRFG